MNPKISSFRQKYVWGRCFLVLLYSTKQSRSRGQVEVLRGLAVATWQGSPSFFCPGFMLTMENPTDSQFEEFRERDGKVKLICRHLGFIKLYAKTQFPHCFSENGTDLFELRAGCNCSGSICLSWLCQYCSLECLDSCVPPTLGSAPAGSFGWLGTRPKSPH